MADAFEQLSVDEKNRLASWLQRTPHDERPWNLPITVPADDAETFDGRVRRLIERVQAEHGLRMCIRPRRVHDEKCRYVLLEKKGPGFCNRTVCRIDKQTGAILPTDNGPVRGFLTDPNPSRCFGRDGLLYVSDLQRIDPGYNAARRREYAALLDGATQNSKAMSSRDRKRLHAGVWDESGIRRKRVLTTNVSAIEKEELDSDGDDDVDT